MNGVSGYSNVASPRTNGTGALSRASVFSWRGLHVSSRYVPHCTGVPQTDSQRGQNSAGISRRTAQVTPTGTGTDLCPHSSTRSTRPRWPAYPKRCESKSVEVKVPLKRKHGTGIAQHTGTGTRHACPAGPGTLIPSADSIGRQRSAQGAMTSLPKSCMSSVTPYPVARSASSQGPAMSMCSHLPW